MSEFPKIVTFYSFKGGVGRSMAVLNAAYALAARGRHVLVLDMDLEAPGLSGFLRRENEIDGTGRQDMVDLIGWASDAARVHDAMDESAKVAFPPLSDYIVNVPPEKIQDVEPESGSLGRLDIIPVDEQRDYYGRLTGLNIGGFDRDALLRTGSLLRSYLKSRVVTLEVPDYYGPDAPRTAPFDYVLVDSRTGVTEIGGLCIGPLSDILVVLTALNDQNVEGTRRFLEEVGILAPRPNDQPTGSHDTPRPLLPSRLDPKPTLIVASPVPAGELKTKKERLDKLRAAVGDVVLKLSYHPQMALFETVFVRDHHDEYLTQEYLRLVDKLIAFAGDAPDGGLFGSAYSTEFRSEPETRRRILHHLVRQTTASKEVRQYLELLVWPLFSVTADELKNMEDADFILLDRLCRVGSSQLQPRNTLETWANALLRWSKETTDAQLALLRGSAAIDRWSTLIEMADGPAEQKATALVNRGIIYGQLDELEKEIIDYTTVVDMADAPAEQKAKALSNRGWTKYTRRDFVDAVADYREAIAIAPDYGSARGNLAIALLVSGRTDEAFDAYEEALALADEKAVSDMESDLRTAMADHDTLPGADKALERLEARRKQIEAPGVGVVAGWGQGNPTEG